MATKINPLVINKKTNPKLKTEETINPLVIRTGVKKGIKTNIKINENENGVPIKKPRGSKKGILSLDQKWRVYKTEVEPKLTDRLLQAEPSEMLENIKQAFHETVAPGMAKLLSDTKKDNADLNSDIITPSHINTSIKQKTEVNKESQKEEDNSMMGRAIRGMEVAKKEKEDNQARLAEIMKTRAERKKAQNEYKPVLQEVIKKEEEVKQNNASNRIQQAFKNHKFNTETKKIQQDYNYYRPNLNIAVGGDADRDEKLSSQHFSFIHSKNEGLQLVPNVIKEKRKKEQEQKAKKGFIAFRQNMAVYEDSDTPAPVLKPRRGRPPIVDEETLKKAREVLKARREKAKERRKKDD